MSETEKTKILIVDDIPANLIAMESILDQPELEILKASSGFEALELVLEHDFALVLLDVQMPEMDGFETAKLMRGFDETKHIPIIFVTAISKEDQYVFEGYDSGAVDYLFKPVKEEILKSKVTVFCDLYRQRKLLQKANQALEAHNTRLEQELQMAREVQEILIPQGVTELAGFRVASHYTPENTVGGDFFDLWEIEPGRLGVFISDVMGHGVSAAFVTVFIKTVVEQIRFQTDDPQHLLDILNTRFDRLISSQLFMFATAFCAIVDLPKEKVYCANAGHPFPFLIRRRQSELEPIGDQTPGRGIGLSPDATYQTFDYPFDPADGLFFYTDGAFELLNPQGDEFGDERLQNLITEQIAQPAEILIEKALNTISQFSNGVPLEDDITIVAIDVVDKG